uniref:Uncharacterized protein n=1 Tax=Arundo donax TaxID=35708 RepID=A0A0A9EJR1_ARUDO
MQHKSEFGNCGNRTSVIYMDLHKSVEQIHYISNMIQWLRIEFLTLVFMGRSSIICLVYDKPLSNSYLLTVIIFYSKSDVPVLRYY